MLALAIALCAATWWWFTREMPRRQQARAVAAQAAMAEAERASSLYRWRDAAGHLHITDTPPKGQAYERIPRQPRDGIAIDGRRD